LGGADEPHPPDRPRDRCLADPEQTAITAVDLGHISQAYARELAASFRASFGRHLFR
jgi:hypothetical protein